MKLYGVKVQKSVYICCFFAVTNMMAMDDVDYEKMFDSFYAIPMPFASSPDYSFDEKTTISELEQTIIAEPIPLPAPVVQPVVQSKQDSLLSAEQVSRISQVQKLSHLNFLLNREIILTEQKRQEVYAILRKRQWLVYNKPEAAASIVWQNRFLYQYPVEANADSPFCFNQVKALR